MPLRLTWIIGQLRTNDGNPHNNAYLEIRRVLHKHGFTWQQGSVYCSGDKINAVTCVLATQDLARSLPWFASPVVDEKGPATAYRIGHGIPRQIPDLWIDPLEVKVVGLYDSLAQAALAAMKPKLADGPFAVRNTKPNPGMTRIDGSVFGGVRIDGAYIYPPPPPVA